MALRDAGDIRLNANAIHDHLALDALIALSKNSRLPSSSTDSIKAYIRELPAYDVVEDVTEGYGSISYKHHEFIVMAVVEKLGTLATANSLKIE